MLCTYLSAVLLVGLLLNALVAYLQNRFRRFDPDYHIVTADSATTGLAVLEKLARQGAEVAIVAADLKVPGMDGVTFLELAHELHRDASRVLLLAMDRSNHPLEHRQLGSM